MGGGTGVAKELQRKQSEPLAKLYCRYFHNVLNELCLNGVSMDKYQIWWLLNSGKVIGAVIPIPKPRILEEGEILNK